MAASIKRNIGRASALPAVIVGAVVLRLITGVGFANYDTLYALSWGGQLARGELPAYDVPIAPTPHPLLELLGLVLSPLGPRAVENVTVALGFLALAGCGWVVYRLGELWFGRAAGALAALILLTRVPILSYGVRAYVDVPYLLLVLSAVLLESRRRAREQPPAGASVLALLALAGLLRPEAWVFSGLYWLYLLAWIPRPIRARLRARALPPAAGADAELPSSPQASGRPPATGSPESSAQGARLARALSELRPGAQLGEPAPARGGAWPRRSRKALAGLTLLAAAAPIAWLLSDLAVTGDALWSLTNTRNTAELLHRVTGIANVPQYIPRRIGEILRPPVLLGAALGGALSLWWLRRRALPGAAAGVLAVLVLSVFAAAGLPINTRYAFLAASILCVFCGAGVFGWTRLEPGDPRRRWWMAGGALVLVALLAYSPAQYNSAHRELDKLALQQRIQNDLLALVEDHAITLRCGPVGVPNHAPIPLLALYLKTSPANVPNAQVSDTGTGEYLDPASKEVEENYVLDPHDPHRPVNVPPGFTEVRANRSWFIFGHCS